MPEQDEAPALTLVGTVHLDPEGYDDLRRLLAALAPDVVTVEVSAYAVAFRAREGDRLLARLAPWRDAGSLPSGLEAVAAQLALPFEYQAARDHCAAHGAGLALLGDDDLSRELLAQLEADLLAPSNLARLASEPGAPLWERVGLAWRRARRELWEPPIGGARADELARLDQALARGLEPFLRPGQRVVHVGGWEHLRGLRQALASHAPQVRLLREGA